MTQKVKLYNGNNQKMVMNVPKLLYRTPYINDVALKHIEHNTGLKFVKNHWFGYEVQPKSTHQIVKLLLTYNFKTQYNDNSSIRNTIILKSCDNAGFDTDEICYNCVVRNKIHVGKGFKKNDILMV